MKQLFLTLALVAITSQLNASGVRGGGESTIDLNGYPELLELVKTRNTTCEWVDGKTYSEKPNIKPHFERIFSKLGELDSFFARDLKEEIYSLDFCRTGPLTKDLKFWLSRYNDILSPVYKNSEFVAFRANDQVYVDLRLADSHSPRSQAYLLIHEAMHSYIPYRLLFRQLKLRSAVKTIEDVELGKIVSRAELHRVLALNGVWYPFSSLLPKGDDEFLMFLSLSTSAKIEWAGRQENLAKSLMASPELKKKLGKDAEVFEPWLSQPYESLIAAVCGSASVQESLVQRIFSDLKKFPYTKSSLPLICLGSMGPRSAQWDANLKLLEDISSSETQVNDYLTQVMARGFTILDGRLAANGPLSKFLGVKEAPYLSISTPGRSTELTGLFSLYAHLANQNKSAELARIYWNNPRFQQAVSLYDLPPKAIAANPPVPREALHSTLQNPVLFSAMMLSQAQVMSFEASPEVARDFVTRLMNFNPGYFVNKNLIKDLEK